jgi:hypothetical protein
MSLNALASSLSSLTIAISYLALLAPNDAFAQASCRDKAMESRIATCTTGHGDCRGYTGTICDKSLSCSSNASSKCRRLIGSGPFDGFRTYYCDNDDPDSFSTDLDSVLKRACSAAPGQSGREAQPTPKGADIGTAVVIGILSAAILESASSYGQRSEPRGPVMRPSDDPPRQQRTKPLGIDTQGIEIRGQIAPVGAVYWLNLSPRTGEPSAQGHDWSIVFAANVRVDTSEVREAIYKTDGWGLQFRLRSGRRVNLGGQPVEVLPEPWRHSVGTYTAALAPTAPIDQRLIEAKPTFARLIQVDVTGNERVSWQQIPLTIE